MLESGLFFALGFLSAVLLALLISPTLWRRAVALTQARVASALPMTMDEIQADKDQIRADYAMKIRKLEMKCKDLQQHNNQQFAKLNSYRDTVTALEVSQEKSNQRIANLTFNLEKIKNHPHHQPALTLPTPTHNDAQTDQPANTIGAEQNINDLAHAELARLRVDFANLEIQLEQKTLELQALHDENKTTQSSKTSKTQPDMRPDIMAETRERIAQLAAQVTALNAQQEGPQSPINKILKQAPKASLKSSKKKAKDPSPKALSGRIQQQIDELQKQTTK